MRFLFLLTILLAMPCFEALGATVRGKVTDQDGNPVPYVNIYVENTSQGTATNTQGDYILNLEKGAYTLRFSALGFETEVKDVELRSGETKTLNVSMNVAATNLYEFEVLANKRDRAKEIMQLVRDKRRDYLYSTSGYECSSYLKTSLETQRTTEISAGDSIDLSRMEIIWVDSMAVDTLHKRMFSNLFEISSTLFYEAPGRFKESIHAFEEHKKRDKNPAFGRAYSVEADFDFEPHNIAPSRREADNVYVLYPDNTAADINFYRNTIEFPTVTQKPLLSPIAASSFLSYLYDYEGYFMQDDQKIHRLKVTPILASEALFEGTIFIEDSTWALRSVELEVNKAALVYCEKFSVRQTYEQIDSGIYLPTNLGLDYTIMDSPDRVFGMASARYSNYTVDRTFESNFFSSEIKTYDPEAFDRDSTFWMDERPELLNATEVRFIDESDSLELYYVSDEYYYKLDSAYNRLDWWTPLIGWGHRNRAKGNEIYIEGLLGQVNPIGVGGYRHQLPIHYQKDFKNDMIFETDLRPDFGFYNEDFKFKAGIGLTYVPKRFVRTYIEVGDFYERINPFSSIEQIFARSNFVNATTFRISQRMEVINGLFAELTYQFSDQKPITNIRISPWEELLFSDLAERQDFDRYTKSEFKLEVQYRFRQKYFLKGNKKIIVGSDYPEFFGVWRKGIPDMFNSEVNFDYVELGVRDDAELARFGSSSWRVFGGTFLNKADLRPLEYKFLRGSDELFFSDPTLSLQLLGPTFNTPFPFVQANYIHHFEGTLLNKVPLINKLKLELAAGGAGLFVEESNFAQVELFAGLEKAVRIKKQLFKFGLYAVTADNSASTAEYTLKFGINFFNTFTNKWQY